MQTRRRPTEPARQLRRHPLWLVRPFAIGSGLLAASIALALGLPGLLDSAAFRLGFAAMELLVFWRYYLLPFIAWRFFQLLIGEDRIEVVQLERLDPSSDSFPLPNSTISISQRLWQIPFNIGTLTVQTGAATVRYTLLTPVRP